MKDEELDQRFARMMEAAEPAPLAPAGARERAVSRMVAGAGARPAPARRRWAVALAGAVVVLAGLGFVPFPAGTAKGTFGKALAMVRESPGVHVTGRIWGPVGEWRFEQWFSRDGFARFDLWDERALVRSLYDPGVRAIYPKWREAELARQAMAMEREGTMPELYGVWRSVSLVGPELDASHLEREDMLPWFQIREQGRELTSEDFWQRIEEHKKALEVRVEERESYRVWGGKRALVDVYGRRREAASGEELWIHMEADVETGAILALNQYKRVEGRWKLIYCVDSIEFGAELGEAVRHPSLPGHHVEIEDTWWGERLPRIVAAGESDDWRVTVHDVEANREGEVFLTFSRQPKTEVTHNEFTSDGLPVPPSRSLSLAAFDDLGTRYAIAREWSGDRPTLVMGRRDKSTEWEIMLAAETEAQVRLRLLPQPPLVPGRVPRAITLVITNEPAKSIPELTGVRSIESDQFDAFDRWFRETYYQTITFDRLRVPVPQRSGNLIAQAIHRTER